LGSTVVIGLLLWFFTNGIRTEVQKLRDEVRAVRALLESDTVSRTSRSTAAPRASRVGRSRR
jgi:hypothetical protein